MDKALTGRIHSLESFGTVDGPGIRFVTFLQGCPLRCQYCHNPYTWDAHRAVKYEYTPQELLDEVLKYKNFIKSGGVTLTGGEPLMQPDFAREYFRLCKEAGLHTALDTSGLLFNPNDTSKIDELLKYTSLVLLDIKHIDDEEHKKLTKHSNRTILAFAKYLSDIKKPMWVRHVVVPGITFDKTYLARLGQFMATLHNIAALDVLPYHDMAIPKYSNLGIPYPLEGVPPLSKEQALEAKSTILAAYKQAREEMETHSS